MPGSFRTLIIAGLSSLWAAHASADGLTDLHTALDRLQSSTPMVARLHSEVWEAEGEGKDRFETSGSASVTLADSSEGFQMRYGNEILARMEGEQLLLAKNPDAPTPTLDAVGRFTPARLRPMISAADKLRRAVTRSRFVAEEPAEYNEWPARLLTFEGDISSVSQRDRKYVRQLTSTLEIWIDDEGVPLASRSRMQLHGRAFIFLRFQHMEGSSEVYAREGDRLITLQRESERRSSGGGENRESRETIRLTPEA